MTMAAPNAVCEADCEELTKLMDAKASELAEILDYIKGINEFLEDVLVTSTCGVRSGSEGE